MQKVWERNDDKFINDLLDDNERLEKENKYLRNFVTKSSIWWLVVILFITLLAYGSQVSDYFKRIINKKSD